MYPCITPSEAAWMIGAGELKLESQCWETSSILKCSSLSICDMYCGVELAMAILNGKCGS